MRDGYGRLPGTSRASVAGALFLFLAALLAAAAPAPARAGDGCAAGHVDEHVRSAWVFDGDTLRLADGRHVRLLGINSPEIAHEDRPAEPLGDAARRYMLTLAPPGTALLLRFGHERHDHYGRTLAHLFLADGRNLQALMVEAGLAFAIAIPPNLAFTGCYTASERQARTARRGIWAVHTFGPLRAASLPASTRGFRLVTGRVRHVGHSTSAVWLDLAPGFAVRIPRVDLRWFDYDPAALGGRRVTARGWVYERHGERRITVRHPADIEVMPR